MPRNLLMAGYFGSGNLGDDAILLGFIQGLGQADVEVTVLSGTPEETYRLYGFTSVPRKDVNAVKRAIEKCDALVFPGGSIFQDVTSVRSVSYYQGLVKMAKAAGKRVFLMGQGVGPVRRFLGRRMTAAAYNAADMITVRDPASAQTLKELGVTKGVRVTADSALILPRPQIADDAQNFAVGNMKTVGISARPHKKVDVAKVFGELAKLLYQANYIPQLVEMDRNEDGALITEISKVQGGKVPELRKIATPMQMQQRMARMDSVIAMRLHAGVLAASVGVPPFMVSYDPKVTAFAKMLDLGPAPMIEGITAQRLFDQFIEFQRSRERHLKVMERRMPELVAAAKTNSQLVLDALGIEKPAEAVAT